MLAGDVLVAFGITKTLVHVDLPLDPIPAMALRGGAERHPLHTVVTPLLI